MGTLTTLSVSITFLIYTGASAALYYLLPPEIVDFINLIFNGMVNLIATLVFVEVLAAVVEIWRAKRRRRRVLVEGVVAGEKEVRVIVEKVEKVDGRMRKCEDVEEEVNDAATVHGEVGEDRVSVETKRMSNDTAVNGERPERASSDTLQTMNHTEPRSSSSTPVSEDDAATINEEAEQSDGTAVSGSASSSTRSDIPPRSIAIYSDDAITEEPPSGEETDSTIANDDELTPTNLPKVPSQLTLNNHPAISIFPLPSAPINSKQPTSRLPTIEIIMVAYLPNEKDIILTQIQYLCTQLDYPPSKIHIIAAYNTPKPIPETESALANLATQYPNLTILKVENSTSKAQNVNAALQIVKGDIIGLFDADHKPDPTTLHFVADHFVQNKYDIIQGRCAVSNPHTSFPSWFIAAEFDIIYGVFHPGRTLLHGFGLFGGTNAFWKADLLKEIGMDPRMLTEDIDSSFRAIRLGARIRYDLNIVSYEMAPESVRSFWNQRLRWSQGWCQVTLRHTLPTLLTGARKAPIRSRIGLLLLLLIRELAFHILYHFLIQLIVKVVWLWLNSNLPIWENWGQLNPYAIALAGWDIFILVGVGVVGYCNRGRFTSGWGFLFYVITAPVYLSFQTMLGIIAHIRELAMVDKWVVTARGSTGANEANNNLPIIGKRDPEMGRIQKL